MRGTTRRAAFAMLAAPVLGVVIVAAFLPAPRSDVAYCTAAVSGWGSIGTLRMPDATYEQVNDAVATLVADTPATLAEAPSDLRDDWEVVLRWARAYLDGDLCSSGTPSGDQVVAAVEAIEEDYDPRCEQPLAYEGETGGLDDG